MDKEAQQIVAFGIMICLICFGLQTCMKTEAEVKRIVKEITKP